MTAFPVRHGILAAIFVLVTLLYPLVLPPLEVRDEEGHFAKAAQLAYWTYPSVREAEQPGAIAPKAFGRLFAEWPSDMPNTKATTRPLSQLWHGLARPAEAGDGESFTSFLNVGSYPSIFYVPQALGLRLGAMAGLSPLGQFYAGREAGAVVAIALVLLSVTLLPIGGTAMLLVAILPGMASQLGSYSADSVIFSVAFLTIAILLRQQAAPTSWSRWGLPVLLPLLTLAKGVYLPLAATGMADRAAWRPRRIAWMLLWIAAGIGLFAVWFGVLASGNINVQHYTSRHTLQHLTAATPHEQLEFMLAHPGRAVWAVLTTMVKRTPVYVVDCIGRFGAFTVTLPLPLYALSAAVLAAGTLSTQPEESLPTPWQRALWLGIVATVLILVHVALYLVSTARGEDYVEGVQGRYFIPVVPLLLLALRMRPGARLARCVEMALPWAAAVLAVGGLITGMTAFWRWA